MQDETGRMITATGRGARQADQVGELMRSTAVMLQESVRATQQQKSAADDVDTALQEIRAATQQLAIGQQLRFGHAERLETLVRDLDAALQRPGRTQVVSLHPLDHLLRAARADWAATGLPKEYAAWRPNVERAIAQVATWRGRRLKLRYRGVTKNHAWLKHRTAALNLRNLTSRCLGRQDSAWVLAT